MTKEQELEAIANDTTGIYTSEQKVKATQALSRLLNTQTGFDPSRAMLAEWYRTFDEPQRHEAFEKGRKETSAPEFSEIEEAKPAKENWLKTFHREKYGQEHTSGQ